VTRALVFGGRGALGSAIVTGLRASGWQVDVASRTPGGAATVILSDDSWTAAGPWSGVVWAQGLNASGGVLQTEDDDYVRLYDANVAFIGRTLRRLVEAEALTVPARGVVVSSIWQLTARPNKVAYVASKAALAGFVPAAAVDLQSQEFALNGVLPGVIDTPMTRSQLTVDQIEGIQTETIGGQLAKPENVAEAVGWLLDPRSRGINGQWIAVDNGWSAVRSV
jgi:3-oxoacyl-[acyl-carrier protein] reductase